MELDLTREERNRGLYFLGKTGSGKSTLLLNLMLADAHAGRGFVFFDPHGVDCLTLLNALPRRRTEDVCYLDLSDREAMVGFNPIIEPHHLVTTFTGIFGDKITDRAQYFLLHGLQLIKDNPDSTLLDLPRLYYDAPFRRALVDHTTDPTTREFWKEQFPSFTKSYAQDAPGTIYNKIGQFLKSPPVRAALSQRHPKLDVAHALRCNQILIVNLNKGGIGREAASLFGALLLSHIHSILFQGGVKEANVYLDEFQSVGTDLVADMLSEDRKYGLFLTLTNLYFSQLRESNRDAILGNIGTLAAFRLGSKDAVLVAPELNDRLRDYTDALMNQPSFHAYVKCAEHDTYDITVAPIRSTVNALHNIILDPPEPALNFLQLGDTSDADTLELATYLFSAIDRELTAKQGTAVPYLLKLLRLIPNATLDTLREIMGEPIGKDGLDQSNYKPLIQQLDPLSQAFFRNQFYSRAEMGPTRKQVESRLFKILGNDAFRSMFAAQENCFDAFDAMQTGKCVLINTAHEKIGTDGSALFGRFMIAQILRAAYQRDPNADNPLALLIIDEAHEYFDETTERVLAQARKYGLGMLFATQLLQNMPERVRASVFGNTTIKFAGPVQYADAMALSREMHCDHALIQGARRIVPTPSLPATCAT